MGVMIDDSHHPDYLLGAEVHCLDVLEALYPKARRFTSGATTPQRKTAIEARTIQPR